MIVITGPGRSGTSALAALYKELGFDPGGEFHPELSAGLETQDVVALNQAVAHELHLTIVGKARKRNRLEDFVGARLAQVVRSRVDRNRLEAAYRRLDALPGRRARRLHLLDWSDLDRVAAKLGPQLVEAAERHLVVKDPRFCWTLPVWLAARAPVDHVVMTSRSLDAAVASRSAAGLMSVGSLSAARNSLAYGIGVCLTTCWDHDVPTSVLRFPEFLSRPDELRRRLPLMGQVHPSDFERAVTAVMRPDMVHDYGTVGALGASSRVS